MSFLAKSPQMPASTAQDAAQFSTYREADPVPMGYGRDFFASRWLCEPFNWRTAYGGQGKPEWQYCSIAAQYRDGPIDFVGKIKRDGKVIANLDYTFDVGEEAHEFTLNPALALGQAWKLIVHRGTETAAASATLIAGTGQQHPPYRGRAWIEWINIDLGQGVAALPDLQVEMGRHAPAVGDFTGGDSHPYGVNPFAAIYALLRNESGFGLSTDYLDAAHWGAQANALEATGIADRQGSQVHCHPIFKSAQDAAALLSTILAHVDGFLYMDGGKFRVGWFPSQAPAGGLPEITEHDLESAPIGAEFPDWNRGPASTVVIFRSFEREYNDTPALNPAPANRETGVVATPMRVERPQIHAADQAAMIAAEISASRGSNEASVTLKVQKSRAVKGDSSPLMPGDLFTWDYGPHSLDLVMRVIGRRIRAGETADLIEAIPERGQFPLPYVPPVDARVLPTPSAPGEINVGDVRLWLLPSGLTSLRKLAPLVNRVHRGIYRVDLHMSTAGAAPWSVILDSRFFASKCAVTNGGINGVAATVRVTSTSVDFARFAAQDAVAQADDALCVLIDNEVCSVGAITVVAANTYDLAILRARRGTAAAAHADAAVAWLFYRDELTSVEHVEFYRVRDGSNAYNAGIATKYFKLQLFTIEEDGLAKPDDPGISLQLPDLTADESAGYTIVLTNEAHTVACANDGTVNAGQLGAGGTARTDVKVLRGGVLMTAVNAGPNSDQFSASIAVATAATGTKEDPDTFRADTLTADTGTLEIDVLVAGAFTIRKVFTLTKAKAGAQGVPGSNGTNGSSLEIEYSADAVSWHPTFTTGDIYMRQRVPPAAFGSAIRIVGQDGVNGTNGTNGVRGSRSFYRALSGAAVWSDVEAEAAITAFGLTKVTLDTVTLYKTSADFAETRFWTGATWDAVAQVIDGNLVVHGTIGGDQLVAGISLVTPLIVGGLLKLNGTCTICADTADGSDTSIVRMNGGGSDGRNRGGQVDCLGNEHAVAPGDVLIGPGEATLAGFPVGTVKVRDRTGTDRLVVKQNGQVDMDGGDVSIANGITTGTGASQRRVLARQPVYGSLNLAGGVTQETVDFSLSNWGFSTRPDGGWLASCDWDRMLIRYDIDDSNSGNAKLRITMADGSNVPAISGMEITGEFVEYD